MSITTDRNDPELHEKGPNGQNKKYIVLSDEELSKGFVEPVRDTYIHTTCGTETRMSVKIAETYARNPGFYGSTWCHCCVGHFPVGENGQFFWKNSDQKVGTTQKGGVLQNDVFVHEEIKETTNIMAKLGIHCLYCGSFVSMTKEDEGKVIPCKWENSCGAKYRVKGKIEEFSMVTVVEHGR